MAELVHEKKLEGISHIQDESDKSGMRVVIELKRGEVPEVVLNNLYKQTQLQDTFGINMVALVDGQPKLCNLKELVAIFLDHRREVVTRARCSSCARHASAATCWRAWRWRLANIDEFIETIKASPTPPVRKAALMGRAGGLVDGREMLAARRSARAARRLPAQGLPPLRPAGRRPVPVSDDQAQEILQMRLRA
jgi:DNA gyrase subunit A